MASVLPLEVNASGDNETALNKNSKSASSDSGFALELEPSIKSTESGSEQGESPVQDEGVNLSSAHATTKRNGPDDVLPASSLMSWERDKPVTLRLGNSGSLSEKPISIMTAMKKTVDKYPDHPALASKVEKNWVKISYGEYYKLVRTAAKGFIKLGLEPGSGVGIIGFNSLEWFVSDLGAIFAGGLASGIYTTNNPEACWYVADSARCNIIVVENDHQLQKILAVWDRLPFLKAVIQYRGEPVETTRNVMSWSKLLEIGAGCADEELEDRIAQQAPNRCCTLIYTSGTTGNPKGVMLSHDNLVWTAKVAGKHVRLVEKTEETISYLPLSHVAAQILDIYIPIVFAGTVYFAQPDALKGSLGDTLKEVQPTSFMGVPRVWEKMQEKMVAVGSTQGTIKRRIASWAKDIGLRGTYAAMGKPQGKFRCTSMPLGWSLANALVFKKVREALGFSRCRLCMTAAAPIMRDTLEYFASLNIPIMEIYGMSESSGPHTVSMPWQFHLTSVGKEFSGCTTKLLNQDEDGNGEVCMNGRNVFMGYLNMEDKTREALDEDGWLHSGDIGRRSEEDYLFITGRIKELIITAGGENVAPIPIEDAVKQSLPCVSNCMLIGDARKFLSILLTIKTELDPTTSEPTTKLTRVARDYFASAGSEVNDVSELLSLKPDDRALRAIQQGIDKANQQAVSRAQLIQKWTVLPRDFTIAGGELGPTLKLKRPVVAQIYSTTIESMYEEKNSE